MGKIDYETKSDRELLIISVENVNELCEKVENHESRLRKMEGKVAWLIGALSVAGVIGGSFGAVVKWG